MADMAPQVQYATLLKMPKKMPKKMRQEMRGIVTGKRKFKAGRSREHLTDEALGSLGGV